MMVEEEQEHSCLIQAEFMNFDWLQTHIESANSYTCCSSTPVDLKDIDITQNESNENETCHNRDESVLKTSAKPRCRVVWETKKVKGVSSEDIDCGIFQTGNSLNKHMKQSAQKRKTMKVYHLVCNDLIANWTDVLSCWIFTYTNLWWTSSSNCWHYCEHLLYMIILQFISFTHLFGW